MRRKCDNVDAKKGLYGTQSKTNKPGKTDSNSRLKQMQINPEAIHQNKALPTVKIRKGTAQRYSDPFEKRYKSKGTTSST